MILTRTYLNGRRAGARKLLGSPQAMHAAILSGFPPGTDAGRVLWRVDNGETVTPTLYIVSRAEPDLAHLDEQAGWPSRRMAESTPYDGFLSQLASGQTWGFRVTVNPTHRVRRDGRSQVLAHVTVAQQTRWLIARADALGVCLAEPPVHSDHDGVPTFTLVERSVRTFRRDTATVTMGVATFQGVLAVTDPDLLRAALVEGIGRGKAYGCGLMTLARP